MTEARKNLEETTLSWAPAEPHKLVSKCEHCGCYFAEHRQDILGDPTRFACPVDGIDWESL